MHMIGCSAVEVNQALHIALPAFDILGLVFTPFSLDGYQVFQQ